MNKHLMVFLITVFVASSIYGQCDKKMLMSSGATEYIDNSNVIQGKDERQTTIIYDSKSITFATGEHSSKGTIDSITCNWKVPFKEGKTIIKATLTRPLGDQISATFTIESKDGKLILLAEFDDPQSYKLRYVLGKFEETK